MDLNTLYRTVIMDNYKNPKNKGLKKSSDYHFVHLNNPSCGDDMNVEILIKNGKVEDIRHDGHGCSICCLLNCTISCNWFNINDRFICRNDSIE